MTITGPFDTGYIGAHRWHVEPQGNSGGGWHWTCVCGQPGNVAGNFAFLLDCFARHAHEALQEAAVALILEHQPKTRQAKDSLTRRAKSLQEAGETDKGNLLMLAASHLHSQLEATAEEQFQSLTWYGWPDDVEGVAPGLAADVDDIWPERFWLEIQPNPYFEPRQFKNWRWEAFRITEGGDETRITSGQADTREEAQRASWDALV